MSLFITKRKINAHTQKEDKENTELKIMNKKAGMIVAFLKTPRSLRALFHPIAINRPIMKSNTFDHMESLAKKEAKLENRGWSVTNEGFVPMKISNKKNTTAETKKAIYALGRFVFNIFTSIFLRMF
tara:strand:- start:191 stop:571 length:381 start_codon:yes stop_codon:yes gene_type:complete